MHMEKTRSDSQGQRGRVPRWVVEAEKVEADASIAAGLTLPENVPQVEEEGRHMEVPEAHGERSFASNGPQATAMAPFARLRMETRSLANPWETEVVKEVETEDNRREEE